MAWAEKSQSPLLETIMADVNTFVPLKLGPELHLPLHSTVSRKKTTVLCQMMQNFDRIACDCHPGS
jgi:hypothetical protein